MTPKRPLIESKRTFFLKNRHILTTKRDSRESRLTQKTTFFRVSLVAHAYSTIIRVPPPPGRIGALTVILVQLQ